METQEKELVHSNHNIFKHQKDEIKRLTKEHKEKLIELRRKEGMTGRAGESHIFRIALDVGLSNVAKVLANTSKN